MAHGWDIHIIYVHGCMYWSKSVHLKTKIGSFDKIDSIDIIVLQRDWLI